MNGYFTDYESFLGKPMDLSSTTPWKTHGAWSIGKPKTPWKTQDTLNSNGIPPWKTNEVGKTVFKPLGGFELKHPTLTF